MAGQLLFDDEPKEAAKAFGIAKVWAAEDALQF